MQRYIALFVSLFFALLCTVAYAHPGKTDSSGGHYDYSTGEYHYHHGYPEHKHTNGHCPYDYDDNTGAGSGSSSSGSQYSWPYTSAPRPPTTPRKTNTPRPTSAPRITKQKESASLLQRPWFYVVIVVAVSLICYVGHLMHENDEKQRRHAEECRRAEEERKRKEAEELRRRQEAEKERFRQKEEERQRMVAYYRNNDLRALSGMPSEIDVKNITRYNSSFRCEVFSAGEPVSVWVSSDNSDVYHKRQCSYFLYPVNPYDTRIRYFKPCKLCSPPPLPDDTWYKEFVRLYTDCLSCGVPPTISPSPFLTEATKILQLYRSKYPATWEYISLHAGDPEKYILTYHQIWGKLQEAHGDGMIFNSLSAADQQLIDYPQLGDSIYLASSNAKTYHSTAACYSLLKSSRPESHDKMFCSLYKRCSKCVPPP